MIDLNVDPMKARPFVLAALMLLAPVGVPASENASPPGVNPFVESRPAEPTHLDPSAFSDVPIPAGRVDAAVAQLDAMAEAALATTGVPGMAIAVVHRDRVVYLKGFGRRSLDGEARVDAETVFQLASLSKPVAATVVAAAVDRSMIAWDDPIVRHLPDFALSDPAITLRVTIADLFAHRSGLPDHAGDLLEDMGYGRAEILSRLRFYPLAPFRASYAYTNFGLTAAAEAVARAAGTPWDDLSRDLLYGPLGMTSTSSRFADFAAAPNHAIGHIRRDGLWMVTPEVRQPDAQSPAGGVSSSVTDMAQWMRLLLAEGALDGKAVIGSEALARIHSPNLMSSPLRGPSSRPSFYGLGLGVGVDSAGRVRWSHSGAFLLGAATTLAMLPSESLGILILTNGQPVGAPEGIAASFLELVETGEVRHDWSALYRGAMAGFYQVHTQFGEAPATPAPARPLDAYVGHYANDLYGPAVVEATEAGLVLRLGPSPTGLLLSHFDGDAFTFRPIGENGLGISGAVFAFEGDRAVFLQVEYLDEEGLGTFRR
ncbi:serine hydrolase [Thiocapsa roseopersicina]|uniref:CubicO group peptidase, beta-lactamase class C family n=1 Tax=Thiocapsa roseopersicina TaxID=1058 RepID=A0A1H2X6L3_THIRO|nr:serine hydrolase [Thiocapsa roseopersicina]SDW88417.1 CubicO group peptidase, beta-lactamase class C family [Thiocapsa roseopersicina]